MTEGSAKPGARVVPSVLVAALLAALLLAAR
jgi:hypothetical protein